MEPTIQRHAVIAEEMQEINIREVNFLEVEPKRIIGEDYKILTDMKPRSRINFVPPKRKTMKRIWQWKYSIFKDWRRDDEELLARCFEEDWSHTRISRLIKNEEDLAKVKALLKQNYSFIKMNYRHYASFSPNGDIWCLQQGVFLDLVHERNITESNKLTDAEVDIKFVATVSSQEIKGNPRNPERGIVRFQFLESVVRLTEQKYVQRGGLSWTDAIIKLLGELCGVDDNEKRKFD